MKTFLIGKPVTFTLRFIVGRNWENNRYVRETRSARDVANFAAKPISANDFVIQEADQGETFFSYWIGRKLFDGVYLIFHLNEADGGEAIRDAIYAKN